MTDRMTDERRRRAEIEHVLKHYTLKASENAIGAMELELLQAMKAEREDRNEWKRKCEMLAEHAAIMQRKYEALVEGITFAQSHTSETLHLLQWDQLGWDVPEEVIESLGKADSELRALLEDDDE